MASRGVSAPKIPVEYKRADGSALICSCGISEFRIIEEPLHLFCRCGLIYTEKDLQEGS